MLVSLNDILTMAEKGGYAIPALNVYNLETVMGVIAAAEEERSPIILQIYSRLLTNEEGYYVSPIILAAAAKASVPVCFHLDHGASEFEVSRAMRYGATGIMIDRSLAPIEENVEVTKRVVDYCNAIGVAVEGEIGHVGVAANGDEDADYTTAEDAKFFVESTGVRALAIAVGTAHGRYKKEPKLAIDRIAEIHAATDVALVLHGGSGIPDAQIKAAIQAGIRKINFSTDLCYTFLDTIFATPRDKVGIDLFMKDAVAAVKQFAISKIRLLGANNRA